MVIHFTSNVGFCQFKKQIVIGFEYNMKHPKKLCKYMYMAYVDGAYYITSNCSCNVYKLEENMFWSP
jgi:hypothetical protein